MELWIRSQDKETLILAQHLDIYCVDKGIYSIEESGNDLGTYEKERAIEILNEIQNALLIAGVDFIEVQQLNIEIKSYFAANLKAGIAIYEMPEN